MRVTTGPTQHVMIQQLCRGTVLTAFEASLLKQLHDRQTKLARQAARAEPAQDMAGGETLEQYQARCHAAHDAVIAQPVPDPEVGEIMVALQIAAGYAIPYKALEHQKCYMRRKMRKPADMPIRQYVGHL